MERCCGTCANEVAGGDQIRRYVSEREYERAVSANSSFGSPTRYCKALGKLVPESYGDGGRCGRWTPDR